MKAEKGEQLSLVGATRPADVSGQRYRDEGGEDVSPVSDIKNLLYIFEEMMNENKSTQWGLFPLLYFSAMLGFMFNFSRLS